jgi:hypothetical protein
MARRNPKDERHYAAWVSDGTGTGVVWIVDGRGRPINDEWHNRHSVVGVHTEAEAIAAAKAEGFTVEVAEGTDRA